MNRQIASRIFGVFIILFVLGVVFFNASDATARQTLVDDYFPIVLVLVGVQQLIASFRRGWPVAVPAISIGVLYLINILDPVQVSAEVAIVIVVTAAVVLAVVSRYVQGKKVS